MGTARPRLSDPERELALSYARREDRAALRALWALDERFGAIVADTSEAVLGEMRLLWWREAVEAGGERAAAEPLLEAVAAILADRGGPAGEWGAIAEGWHALLQSPLEAAELERFAAQRGGRLFALSAALLGAPDEPAVERAGRGWALADLGCRMSDPDIAERARAAARGELDRLARRRWPRRLRPLGALTALARRDAAGPGRRQGSPARVARMAWHRLTGR